MTREEVSKISEFRFSMVVDGIERVTYVKISESELTPINTIAHFYSPEYMHLYRKNVIEKHLQKWALSHINLSWEELMDHDKSDTDQQHTGTPKQHQA